jgi:hypothetical protein
MVKVLFMLAMFASILQFTNAQVRTEEKKTTVNEKTGDTTVTKSVIVSKSEDVTPRHHMIVINPLKFLLFYNISYYQRLSDEIAVGGGIQAPTISSINGFGFNAEVRIHPSAKSLRGFYFAPNISYNHLTTEGSEVTSSPFSVGGLIGWQWFPGDDFAMGLGIGIDYYIGSVSHEDNNLGKYDGAAPALRFDIGYGW